MHEGAKPKIYTNHPPTQGALQGAHGTQFEETCHLAKYTRARSKTDLTHPFMQGAFAWCKRNTTQKTSSHAQHTWIMTQNKHDPWPRPLLDSHRTPLGGICLLALPNIQGACPNESMTGPLHRGHDPVHMEHHPKETNPPLDIQGARLSAMRVRLAMVNNNVSKFDDLIPCPTRTHETWPTRSIFFSHNGMLVSPIKRSSMDNNL